MCLLIRVFPLAHASFFIAYETWPNKMFPKQRRIIAEETGVLTETNPFPPWPVPVISILSVPQKVCPSAPPPLRPAGIPRRGAPVRCNVGRKSRDPFSHKKCMEAGVMTFVAHCTLGRVWISSCQPNERKHKQLGSVFIVVNFREQVALGLVTGFELHTHISFADFKNARFS